MNALVLPDTMLHALPSDLRIGFIGAGRLAGALALACESAGLAVTQVASTREASAQRMAALLASPCATGCAQSVADGCDLVFITTPDSAIADTVEGVRWRTGQAVVHCSGATDVDTALAAAHAQGAWIGGFHPMQTFADPQAAARSLPGCTITIEARAPQLDGWLVDLATRLGCRVNRLPPGMRARYHAAAGYGSQFINALFAEAARLWGTWGASEHDAVQALLPLARGTLAAIEAVGISAGMPGPVSRGDLKTVAQHLASFDPEDAPGLAAYRLLCGRTVDLVERRGAVAIESVRALRTALAQALAARVA